jgi:hypothetical protein
MQNQFINTMYNLRYSLQRYKRLYLGLQPAHIVDRLRMKAVREYVRFSDEAEVAFRQYLGLKEMKKNKLKTG